MSNINSYFNLGLNDLLYAKSGMDICENLGNYNAVASGCAQACEKFLKSMAELCLAGRTDAVRILKTHNLRLIAREIKSLYPDLDLNERDCKWVGDFYYDARYPGDNFIEVDKPEAEECLKITNHIYFTAKAFLDSWREKHPANHSESEIPDKL